MAKQRQEMLFGIRAAMEAINSEKEIEKVLIRNGLAGPLYNEFFELVRTKDVQYQFVPKEKIDALDQRNNLVCLTVFVPVSTSLSDRSVCFFDQL